MKKIFLLIFILLPILSMSQTSNINGVVTYYFNKTIGDKPDIGAKVYLIDSLNSDFFKYQTIDSFLYSKAFRRAYSSYSEMYKDYITVAKSYEGKKKHLAEYTDYKAKADDAKKYMDEYFIKISNFGVDTDEKFEALDKRAAQSIIRVNEDNSILKTVDGIGNYNANIKPGTYYVLIISKGRNDLSMSEVSGRIFYKKIKVKENESKTLNKYFDLY